METFIIRIFNGVGCEIYHEPIKARDENEAIIKVLEEVTICTDDKIIIEEE